jgi:signal transduction histidine kinase
MNSVVHGFKDKNGGVIHIELRLNNGQVIIDYRDDGSGLDASQQEKVFEPFYTTARGSGGTGLGMSISYNLVVSKLGGTIHCVDSATGAHFQISLPVI